MKDVLNPHHFIFTPENPKHKGKYGQNPSIEDVTKFLNDQGEDAQIVNGFYDAPERSILVQSPKNTNGLFQMAKDFGQDSALHSQNGKHELHYLNGQQEGQVVHGQGTSFSKTKPANNYTEIHTVDGPLYFQHNLDFDPTNKSEPLDKASWNVREQRKKVWGTNPNPSKNSKMGQKHINHIKDFAKKFLGLDLHPSGGKINEKTGQRRDDNPTVGTDKPDWRSGQLESQWNPDAIIHELAHLILLPKGLGLVEGQKLMDKHYGEVQSKYGYMQQKRSQHEIQPMAAEQLIRRFLGLPASQKSIPVDGPLDEPRTALEPPHPVVGARVVQGQTKTGEDKWVDLVRQSRNLTPENRQRVEDVLSRKLVFHPEQGWIPNTKPDPVGVNVASATPENASPAVQDEEKLAASEDLKKAPLRYDSYTQESQDNSREHGLPDFMNSERHEHVKTAKLPNGLEYRQFRPSMKGNNQFPRSQKIAHALYHPSNLLDPLAYMETEHEEDPMADNGRHPNVVQWSEVAPEHRGKGLGRQLYLATMLHGVGQLTSGSSVSPDAHKAWLSFRGIPGIGGRIAKYPKSTAEHFMSPGESASYDSDRHHVFVRDKHQVDMNKAFPKVDLDTDRLASSENYSKNDLQVDHIRKSIASLDEIRLQLEKPNDEVKVKIPDNLVIQWSVPSHRWGS